MALTVAVARWLTIPLVEVLVEVLFNEISK